MSVHAFLNRIRFQSIFKIEHFRYFLNQCLHSLISLGHTTMQFSFFSPFLSGTRHTQTKTPKSRYFCFTSAALPCIPAGPKSCLVKKMAWSWCSEWLGSDFCCWYAQRQTFSRLLEGFPLSIKLMDWKSNILEPGYSKGKKFSQVLIFLKNQPCSCFSFPISLSV